MPAFPNRSRPSSPPSVAKQADLKQCLLDRKERGAERNDDMNTTSTSTSSHSAGHGTEPLPDHNNPKHSIQKSDAEGNPSVQSVASVAPFSSRLHPSLPMKPVAATTAAAAAGVTTVLGAARDSWRGRELLAPSDEDLHNSNKRDSRGADGDDGRLRRRMDYDTRQPRDMRYVERGGADNSVSGSSAGISRSRDWRDAPPHISHISRSHYESSTDSYRPSSGNPRMRRTSPAHHDSYRPNYDDDDSPRRDDRVERDLRERDTVDHPGPRGGANREPADRRDEEQTAIPATGTGSRHSLDPRRGDLPLPPPPHSMPPFQPTMASVRHHPNKGGGGNANLTPSGPMNLEQRRQLRESTVVNIWPESPKRPCAEEERNLESKSRRSKSSKPSRRKRRYTSETETDSEEEYERERRRRKRRERERRSEKHQDDDRDERTYRTVDDERDRDRDRDRDRKRGRRSRSRRQTSEDERDHDVSPARRKIDTIDDGPEVGPQLPAEHTVKDKLDREAFRNLLPGEGQGMQAFVEKGERIPRRGEIGMDMKKIQEFEESGYVMSGSRHQRMNAVRIRKEGQVINAEEKRAFLKQSREEWIEKEGAIISQFKEMMDERLKMEERREREREDKDRGKGKSRERR